MAGKKSVQSSFLKFIGTLDGINFYIDGNGVAQQRKAGGGFNAAKIKNDPSMERVRQNAAEMGNCAKQVKAFKQLLYPVLHEVHDPKLHQRLMGLFFKLKTFDTTSGLGKRLAGQGMLTAEGQRLLRYYRITGKQGVHDYIGQPFVFDGKHQLTIPDCDGRYFNKRDHYTHLYVKAMVLYLHPDTMEGELCMSTPLLLPTTIQETVTQTLPDPSMPYAIALPMVYTKCVQLINGQDHVYGAKLLEVFWSWE